MTKSNSSSTLTSSNADEAAVREIPERMIAVWANNDGSGLADLFTEDGSLILPGDVFLKSREEIRAYMTAAYAGPYKGTKVAGTPVTIRFVGTDTSLIVTEGGVLLPGETAPAPERAIRATWVLAKQDDDWRIVSYQNSPATPA